MTATAMILLLIGWTVPRKGLPCVLVMLFCAAQAAAGPTEAVAAAAADLKRLAEEDREHVGYLWRPTPVITGSPAIGIVAGLMADLGDFDAVLRYHVNQLSRKGGLEPPARIAFDVWRVDLRNYGWKRETWEKMAAKNVYFNEEFTKKVTLTVKGKRRTRTVKRVGPSSWLPTEPIAFLIEQTGSKTPIVSGPWFLANTCRQLSLENKADTGFGYYDWLQVANRNEFFKLADVRLKQTRKRELDILEAVDKSKVSKQNRQIDSEPTINGRLFFTLDTNNEFGRGNAIKNLQRGDYVHQAEEHYLPLANGLPAYFLCDAQGVRQDSAPDFIGPNTSPLHASIDGRIHVCQACISCHAGQVLQPVNGWVRKNYTIDKLALNVPADFKSKSKEEQARLFAELKRQYLTLNFDNSLNAQRELYRRAIQEACGLDAGTLARLFTRVYHQYVDQDVTLEQAAIEMGYTVKQVEAAFIQYGGLEAVNKGTGPGGISAQLGALVPPRSEPLKRLHWEENWNEAMRIMVAYKPGEQP